MNEVTYKMIDDVTQRIAYKIGKDYGLIDRDFAIKFWPVRKFDYVIKSGGIIRVYFTHTPKFVEYESMLRRCLQQVALIKKNKKTGIIVYGSDKIMTDQLHKDYPEWEALPSLLPFDQLKFTTEYKVSMTHRKTGLTVVKEGHIGRNGKTIPRLMIDARSELSDLVSALERARSDNEEELKALTINKVGLGILGNKTDILQDTLVRLKMVNYGDSGNER